MRVPTVEDLAARVPRVEDFSARVRGPELTSRVGMWLGIAMLVAFLTGVWSHLQQDTPGWLSIPPSPVWLYRVTQGVHVLSGCAAVPLLLVKLWSVYPRLFLRPPKRLIDLAVHGAERALTAVLVAAAIFQLASGLMNSAQWYPWSFSFRATHYAVGWILIGAIALHIAVKLPLVRRALGAPLDRADAEESDTDGTPVDGIRRRTVLRATWLAAGVAVIATAGQTVPWLRRVSIFGTRTGDGPQDLPVNRSAEAAGVDLDAFDDWELEVTYGDRTMRFDRAALEAMSQSTHDLPIACVEGWSANASWTGVPVRDIIDTVGAPSDSRVLVMSMQTQGAFGSSELPGQFVADERTMLALRVNGETLDADHGYPCRVIAPNRPGVLQTKWVRRLEVYA